MRFTLADGGVGMKIISKTKGGALVDMSLDELGMILDKTGWNARDAFVGYGGALKDEWVGKTIHLADIWKKMHDHVRLKSGLDALKIELSKLLGYCERAQPIADEVAGIIEPKAK